MAHYFFTVQASEGDASERAVDLNDDAAALAYACELARELMRSHAGRPDRRARVIVRDGTRPMVLSVPVLAACA